MRELDLFVSLDQDKCFKEQRSNNPILAAMFYALFEFVKTGKSIKDLPWFN